MLFRIIKFIILFYDNIKIGVPRVWEKIEEKMKDAGRESKGLKKMIGDWAKSVGANYNQSRQFGAPCSSSWSFIIANKLVFSNVSYILSLFRQCLWCLFFLILCMIFIYLGKESSWIR